MVFSKNLEVILVFYREAASSVYKSGWVPIKKEYKDYVNEIWKFAGESAKRVGHPAPFPIELPRRLIRMMSNKEDIILDPFCGSGSTLIACKQLQRKGIGVEISEEYFELTKRRLVFSPKTSHPKISGPHSFSPRKQF